MGANPSKPEIPVAAGVVVASEATKAAPSACPVKHTTGEKQADTSSDSFCPVKRTKPDSTPSSFCPVKRTEDPAKQNSESACPVKHSDKQPYKNPTVYNVYSTKIDPTNQMPATANQQPSANQAVPLSVDRVKSSIPKGGTDQETWAYPSAQMFWNALVRKNKTEGVAEQDMDTVIAIHNNMNENTWKQVMEWEKLVNDPEKAEPGRESKLLKFCGRPDELSPKARLKVLFGHPAPFDRHDWTIDRGGKEVRYIIDYYHDESAVQKDKTPQHMTDPRAMQSIKVDVRPALDSPASILARLVLMPWRRFQGTTAYSPPPFFAPKIMLDAEQNKLQRISQDWKEIATKCVDKKNALQACGSEEECRAASVALQVCTASVVCPSVASAFKECTAAPDSAAKGNAAGAGVDMKKAAAAYSALVQCLELFEIDSLKAYGKDSAEIEARRASAGASEGKADK